MHMLRLNLARFPPLLTYGGAPMRYQLPMHAQEPDEGGTEGAIHHNDYERARGAEGQALQWGRGVVGQHEEGCSGPGGRYQGCMV